jgi:hypothetical protein
MATTITAGNSTNGAAISSDNTGILELKTGTGSGTTGLTINASQNTTLAGTLSAGAITSSGLVTGATGALYPLVSGTSQTAPFTAPNTYADFTGIPSWARRVTVMLAGVTTTGTSPIIIQIGAGSFATTLYSGTAGGVGNSGNVMTVTSYTNGFGMAGAMSSADQKYNGNLLICLVDSATGLWAASGSTSLAPGSFTGVQTCGGSRTLSGTLDRVRITTSGGTATFTAGTVNLLWE